MTSHNNTPDRVRKALVSKDRWRDPDGKEYVQYTIVYEDHSGKFVRVLLNETTPATTKAIRRVR